MNDRSFQFKGLLTSNHRLQLEVIRYPLPNLLPLRRPHFHRMTEMNAAVHAADGGLRSGLFK